jgi:hypothetical protein
MLLNGAVEPALVLVLTILFRAQAAQATSHPSRCVFDHPRQLRHSLDAGHLDQQQLPASAIRQPAHTLRGGKVQPGPTCMQLAKRQSSADQLLSRALAGNPLPEVVHKVLQLEDLGPGRLIVVRTSH